MTAEAHYTVLLVFASRTLDRFLMARHRDRGWELPGGRIEAGEDLGVSARREWSEETGLPLAALELLLLHHRPDGSKGHVFLGRMVDARDADPTTVAPAGLVDEKIVEVRWVRALSEVAPLAFPDDPYPAVARAVLGRRRASKWVFPAQEREAAFIQRLSAHPEATPRGHKVERHPAAGPVGSRAP